MPTVASISDPAVAINLLDPLRARILALASEPLSASQFAERVGLPRQRVNYHVKKLKAAGLLLEAGRRDRRNLTEVLYQASASRYVVDPAALGGLAPEPDAVPDKMSAEHLLALASRTQGEVARAHAEASAAGRKAGVVTVDLDVRLPSGPEREAFARALEAAVSGVVERFGGRGGSHRLVAAVHPKP